MAKKMTDSSNENVSKITHRASPNVKQIKRSTHYANMHPSSKGIRGDAERKGR